MTKDLNLWFCSYVLASYARFLWDAEDEEEEEMENNSSSPMFFGGDSQNPPPLTATL